MEDQTCDTPGSMNSGDIAITCLQYGDAFAPTMNILALEDIIASQIRLTDKELVMVDGHPEQIGETNKVLDFREEICSRGCSQGEVITIAGPNESRMAKDKMFAYAATKKGPRLLASIDLTANEQKRTTTRFEDNTQVTPVDQSFVVLGQTMLYDGEVTAGTKEKLSRSISDAGNWLINSLGSAPNTVSLSCKSATHKSPMKVTCSVSDCDFQKKKGGQGRESSNGGCDRGRAVSCDISTCNTCRPGYPMCEDVCNPRRESERLNPNSCTRVDCECSNI